MTSNTGAGDPVARRMADQSRDTELRREGDRWVLTLNRLLPHPLDSVWVMLTDPERLAMWSPIVPDRALASTGPATARESLDAPVVDVEVLRFDPPHELVHRWGADELRWTLEPARGGTLLRLAHTMDNPAMRAPNAAGWHLLLAVLAALLDGEDVPRVVGRDAARYEMDAIRAEYAARWD